MTPVAAAVADTAAAPRQSLARRSAAEAWFKSRAARSGSAGRSAPGPGAGSLVDGMIREIRASFGDGTGRAPPPPPGAASSPSLSRLSPGLRGGARVTAASPAAESSLYRKVPSLH